MMASSKKMKKSTDLNSRPTHLPHNACWSFYSSISLSPIWSWSWNSGNNSTFSFKMKPGLIESYISSLLWYKHARENSARSLFTLATQRRPNDNLSLEFGELKKKKNNDKKVKFRLPRKYSFFKENVTLFSSLSRWWIKSRDIEVLLTLLRISNFKKIYVRIKPARFASFFINANSFMLLIKLINN